MPICVHLSENFDAATIFIICLSKISERRRSHFPKGIDFRSFLLCRDACAYSMNPFAGDLRSCTADIASIQAHRYELCYTSRLSIRSKRHFRHSFTLNSNVIGTHMFILSGARESLMASFAILLSSRMVEAGNGARNASPMKIDLEGRVQRRCRETERGWNSGREITPAKVTDQTHICHFGAFSELDTQCFSGDRTERGCVSLSRMKATWRTWVMCLTRVRRRARFASLLFVCIVILCRDRVGALRRSVRSIELQDECNSRASRPKSFIR